MEGEGGVGAGTRMCEWRAGRESWGGWGLIGGVRGCNGGRMGLWVGVQGREVGSKFTRLCTRLQGLEYA